jgi:hypothetical protein
MIYSRIRLSGGQRVTAAVVISLLLFDPLPLRAANDCPTALTGKGSFVVERQPASKTEVFYGDGPTIRTVLRYQDRTLLETTLYEGLFELGRVDRGTKIEQKPKTDLGKFFPLKPKQKIAADFDVTMSGRNETWPIFYDDIDYYAPELKLVVAKEYREGNGRTTIIGYTRISSVKP